MSTFEVSKKYSIMLLIFASLILIMTINSIYRITIYSGIDFFELSFQTIGIVGFYLSIAFFLFLKLITSRFHLLHVDSTKVTFKKQFISKSIQTIESHQLEGLSIKQGPLGRVLNYGKLRMTGTGGLRITTIPLDNVYFIAQEIRNINPRLGVEGSKTYQSEMTNIAYSANELEKLSQLLEKGLITREEFDGQKKKLLG